MKFGSMRYLLREGFRSIWQNRFMSLASVFVLFACLLLAGMAYMVFVNINQAFDRVYEQNIVVVYAEPDASDYAVNRLGDALRGLDNVATVEFRSGEEALEDLRDHFSDELYEQMKNDPSYLQDSYIVSFADIERFEESVKAIEGLATVDTVEYSGDITDLLTKVRTLVLGAGVWMIVLLLVVSLFIIVNTIKLTVHNRRLEIRIMKSVGATDSFIRIPFVVEGTVLGLLAGVLAFLLLFIAYDRLCAGFAGPALFGLVPFAEMWGILLAGTLLAGALTGAFGSGIAIRRYLHKEGGLS